MIMTGIRLAYMIINLPFSALRAFETVVRHSGFSAAASELGISQSAVSQHVKTLEDWLNCKLLVRGARRSQPTPEGEELARAITVGLGQISDVCSTLRDRSRSDRTIVIGCLPGFAFTWLFPRLTRFDLTHPHLSISVSTETTQGGVLRNGVDVAICYGDGTHPGLETQELLQEQLFPVCAPGLMNGDAALRDIPDLGRFTLLQDESHLPGQTSSNWAHWARACNVSLPAETRTRRLGPSNMVIQAAIEGLGVAIGREPLVIDALCDGRLVRPFPQISPSPNAYWLVYRPEARQPDKITEFLSWILSEAHAQPALPAAYCTD